MAIRDKKKTAASVVTIIRCDNPECGHEAKEHPDSKKCQIIHCECKKYREE